MISTGEFRNGMVLNYEDHLYSIVEFQHVKPGKGGAFVRTRLKNIRTGATITPTFRSGDKVEEVRLERRSMQYLYASDDIYYFMDLESYDQIQLNKESISNSLSYLKENDIVDVLLADNKPIGIQMPNFTNLKVQQAEPGVKGDTAAGGTKAALLETGLTVQVPMFVETGDTLRIDTRTGNYVERV